MKKILCLILSIVIFFLTSYSVPNAQGSIEAKHLSYQEVPGVTREEIFAIEALKANHGDLSYGHLVTTEAFKQADGAYTGFTIEVCKLLSDLFDTQFSPKVYDEWASLKSDIDNCITNFSGEFTQTSERMHIYEMTKPIAGRGLNVYNLTSAPEITTEADINGMKVGFLDGAVASELIKELYPDSSFEAVDVPSFSDAAEMLFSEEIDVFVTDGVADTMFEEYNYIRSRDLFQFVYAPVSIATKDPEFKPIISVINKYLDSGGMETMFRLYREGSYEYKKHKLNLSFTDEEREYLAELKRRNASVNVAFQHDAYPASFYNSVEKRYDGAAYDILTEVSELTGIVFNSECMPIEKPLSEILAKLKSGEVSMMPQLLYSESRKDDYIWSDISYITTNYALLSKNEYHNLQPFQIYYATVGTINKSAHAEVFTGLFPNHEKTIVYQTGDEGFDALERGEIDLLMLAETMLLVQTNYREKLGYKVNITFNKTLDTLFGYNKDEVILRDIIDKSMSYVDIKGIEESWLSRVFDYQSKMLRDAIPFIVLFVVLLLAALFVVFLFFMKNRKINKNLERIVANRTGELALQTSTLTTIFESIPDLVFCKDLDLRFTRCNKRFESYFNCSNQDIIGKDDETGLGIPADMAEQFRAADREVIRGRRITVIEESIPSADGTERLFETIKTPLMQDGVPIGIMGISRDITQRNEVEKELQAASRAKSDFLSRMSHEIRTPLNAIMGMIGIAQGAGDTEKIQHCLARADSASKHLLGVINDILDMSKIEADKFELDSREFDFEKMLMNITDVANFRAEEKNHKFIVNLNKNVPEFIVGDDLRLSQVITNLLSNAVKFTPEGGTVMLNVDKTEESGENVTLRIEVADTGIGISAEQQSRLFTSFEQADGGTARKFGGTGLGLAISKRIVELMGGRVWIESELGQGSKFIFTIKVRKVDKTSHEKLSEAINIDNLRILAVCDSLEISESFTHIMASLDLPCDVASGGRQALDMVERSGNRPYNLFFVDWQMTEMNGIEFTKKIKEVTSDNSVVFMISVAEWGNIEEEALAAGVKSFVSKPLFPSTLINTINECLMPEQKRVKSSTRDSEYGISPSFKNHAILIAEDVEINREIMTAILEDMGVSIDYAENGQAAVSMFRQNSDKYSLILMDIHMPIMDGYEATRTIRALETLRAKNIPIIAMTANVFREDVENCLSAGMNDHIGKPINVDELVDKLNTYM